MLHEAVEVEDDASPGLMFDKLVGQWLSIGGNSCKFKWAKIIRISLHKLSLIIFVLILTLSTSSLCFYFTFISLSFSFSFSLSLFGNLSDVDEHSKAATATHV